MTPPVTRSDSLAFYTRLRIALIGGYAVVAAGICGAATWYALHNRTERLDAATHNASTLVRALDEHVRRAFGAVDVLLADVAADIAAEGGVTRVPEARLHRTLRAKQALIPQARSLFVYGPDLILHAGSGFMPIRRVDGSGLEHVAAHRQGGTPSLYVGRPHVSPLSGQWAISVTRRIALENSRLGGVVGASIDQDHFDAFYRDLGLSPGQGFALMRNDGTLIFRFPQTASLTPGLDLSGSPLFREGLQRSPSGVLRFVGEDDAVERIFAFRKISDLAVVVVISHRVEEILAPWRRDIAAIAAGVAGALVALSVLLWIALRHLTAEQLAAAEVQRLNETLEEQVRSRTAELKAANEELEAFSYSVSHDLRAPLRAMAGFLGILRTEHAAAFPPEALALLERSEAAAKRMGQLIENLLGLARVSRQDMHKAQVELSTLAAEIAAELADANPARKVEVRVAPGLSARADPALIRVALQNLLGNAWKYTARSAQARVEFGAESPGAERVFYVRDNGAGFDMQYAAQLFRPFQRLHSDREYEGSGIGLATVERIIRRHGGRVWAEAAPERGATFRFTLP